MAHNLFISYDLVSPGQNYDAVRCVAHERLPVVKAWADLSRIQAISCHIYLTLPA